MNKRENRDINERMQQVEKLMKHWPHPNDFDGDMMVSVPGIAAYMYVRELALAARGKK